MTTSHLCRPVLESGDRLPRAEFHNRYQARDDIMQAELIQGVVYVASPVRRQHGRPHAIVMGWLLAYVARQPELEFGDNTTVGLSAETEVQPDAFLARGLATNSRLALTTKDYYEGTPDLVVGIAASSASYDLHDKLRAYEQAGVPEYLVWRVLDQQLDWFRLHEGAYAPVQPDAQGIIESATFPGLRLSVPKLLAEDVAGVLAELA